MGGDRQIYIRESFKSLLIITKEYHIFEEHEGVLQASAFSPLMAIHSSWMAAWMDPGKNPGR